MRISDWSSDVCSSDLDDVGVEQEVHRSTFRGRSFLRLISTPESRSGEVAKNSARLPVRFVFRSHSSAETTTAAVRPCLVMVCGPFDWACSMSSLNRALASATVQLPMLMPSTSIWRVPMVIIFNFLYIQRSGRDRKH